MSHLIVTKDGRIVVPANPLYHSMRNILKRRRGFESNVLDGVYTTYDNELVEIVNRSSFTITGRKKNPKFSPKERQQIYPASEKRYGTVLETFEDDGKQYTLIQHDVASGTWAYNFASALITIDKTLEPSE